MQSQLASERRAESAALDLRAANPSLEGHARPRNFSPSWSARQRTRTSRSPRRTRLATSTGPSARGRVRTAAGKPVDEPIEAALIRADRAIAYPIRDGIPVMLATEGLALGEARLHA